MINLPKGACKPSKLSLRIDKHSQALPNKKHFVWAQMFSACQSIGYNQKSLSTLLWLKCVWHTIRSNCRSIFKPKNFSHYNCSANFQSNQIKCNVFVYYAYICARNSSYSFLFLFLALPRKCWIISMVKAPKPKLEVQLKWLVGHAARLGQPVNQFIHFAQVKSPFRKKKITEPSTIIYTEPFDKYSGGEWQWIKSVESFLPPPSLLLHRPRPRPSPSCDFYISYWYYLCKLNSFNTELGDHRLLSLSSIDIELNNIWTFSMFIHSVE